MVTLSEANLGLVALSGGNGCAKRVRRPSGSDAPSAAGVGGIGFVRRAVARYDVVVLLLTLTLTVFCGPSTAIGAGVAGLALTIPPPIGAHRTR